MVYRESTTTTPSPRHLMECLSTCPIYIAAYVARHVDTIGKLLNHLLCFMLLCDVLVFLASWNLSFLPALGFNTVLLSFLLCVQTISVGLILNSSYTIHHRLSALSWLSPTTEFTVGIAFGITVGAAILAFVLSSTYHGQCTKSSYQHHAPAYRLLMGVPSNEINNYNYTSSTSGDHDIDDNPDDFGHRYHPSNYYENDTTEATPTTTVEQHKSLNYYDDYPVGNYACLEKRGSVNAIWFWSGLLVWLNFACCLLLAIGRAELASQSLSNSNNSAYEEVGTVDDDPDYDAFRHSGASTSTPTTFPGDMPIHGGGGMNGTSVSSSSSSPSFGGAAYIGDYSSVPEIRGDGLPKR